MHIPDKNSALARAREVLDGLSVGDAIGEALGYQFYRYGAIVGGIVTGCTGVGAIPQDWLKAREALVFGP